MSDGRLHTYIKCTKCGSFIRASRHTPEQCKKKSQTFEKVNSE